jgi:F-type H+-transporting ATPase subunit epsilon
VTLHLRLLVPSSVLLDTHVSRISADAGHGSFTLLPRHVDFVAALVPGLLAYQGSEAGEAFAAVDEGLLVKCGREVTIATRRAVVGGMLGRLRQTVEREFRSVDEHERAARGVVARLEADFIRRLLELGERARG